jgi:hypothetical protein
VFLSRLVDTWQVDLLCILIVTAACAHLCYTPYESDTFQRAEGVFLLCIAVTTQLAIAASQVESDSRSSMVITVMVVLVHVLTFVFLVNVMIRKKFDKVSDRLAKTTCGAALCGTFVAADDGLVSSSVRFLARHFSQAPSAGVLADHIKEGVMDIKEDVLPHRLASLSPPSHIFTLYEEDEAADGSGAPDTSALPDDSGAGVDLPDAAEVDVQASEPGDEPSTSADLASVVMDVEDATQGEGEAEPSYTTIGPDTDARATQVVCIDLN